MKQILILLLFPFYSFAQEAELSGVVTYFFNDYQGNKPDIGAKVYIIDSSANPNFDFQSLYNFRYGTFYRNLYFRYLEIAKVHEKTITDYGKKKLYKEIVENSRIKAEEAKSMAQSHYRQMEKYGVETNEKYDSLDKRCSFIIYKIDKNNSQLKTVNGVGSYSLKIQPRVYYILLISENRKSLNMTESTGKIYCEKIRIKENESKDVSFNFELY